MNEISLCKALGKFIEPQAAKFTLQTPHGEFVHPKVIVGYMPLKTPEDDFPFILVKHEKSQTTNTGTIVTVGVVVSAFFPGGEDTEAKEGQDGFIDPLNIATLIRQTLLSVPNGTIENKYVLQDIDINLPTEQPFPQWQVDMTIQWYLRVPAIGQFPVSGELW